jgi:hypothetical protein|tara:strand:+ start:672 stop:1142 length:471 start_codon:yes stop_codon:yes gene_type:complete
MIFHIPPPASTAMILSGSHGFTDAGKPLPELTPYAFALLPIPSDVTTACFAGSSIVHFSRDIGFWPSMGFHVLLVALAFARLEYFAWMILSVYMWFLHIPKQISSNTETENKQVLCSFICLLPIAYIMQDSFVFDTFLQKIVVSHIVISRKKSQTH